MNYSSIKRWIINYISWWFRFRWMTFDGWLRLNDVTRLLNSQWLSLLAIKTKKSLIFYFIFLIDLFNKYNNKYDIFISGGISGVVWWRSGGFWWRSSGVWWRSGGVWWSLVESGGVWWRSGGVWWRSGGVWCSLVEVWWSLVEVWCSLV